MEERTGWIVRLRPRMDEIVDGGERRWRRARMEERTGWIVRLTARMDESEDGRENGLDSETDREDGLERGWRRELVG